MTLGQRIKKLRADKELTQKDLADQVHVTFQTVSKWEKGENEPDIATIKQLAKIFDCSVDYLISEDEEEEKPTIEQAVIAPDETVSRTIVVHQHELHVCARCGKDIPEDELVSEDVTKKERHGRATRTVSIGQTFYHKDCFEQVKAERIEKEKKEKALKASRIKKLSFGWGIAGGVVALAIALIFFIANKDQVNIGLGILYSCLISYGIFAMIYCIICGSYIGDVFLWCASLSIRFPGLIFSWDLEGFVWLIAMKILFAILGFLIGVFALLFAIVVSAALGGVSFPFILIHNIRHNYDV